MARIHGKNGIIYLGGAAGSAAVPLTQAGDYDISGDFDLASVAALGDQADSFVKGLQKWTGTLNGPYDTASNLVFDAWGSQQSSPFYLYPDKAAATRYYYGFCWPKINAKGGVGAAVTFSSAITGDGLLYKNP